MPLLPDRTRLYFEFLSKVTVFIYYNCLALHSTPRGDSLIWPDNFKVLFFTRQPFSLFYVAALVWTSCYITYNIFQLSSLLAETYGKSDGDAVIYINVILKSRGSTFQRCVWMSRKGSLNFHAKAAYKESNSCEKLYKPALKVRRNSPDYIKIRA